MALEIGAKNSNIPIKFGYKRFSRRPGRVNCRKHLESWVLAVQPPSLGDFPTVNHPETRYRRFTHRSWVVQLLTAIDSRHVSRVRAVQPQLTNGLPVGISGRVVPSAFRILA
ncbi:hypothetical protein B296_00016913 [Ensete ventricosum]|uniref:Uncharacterized protein n=1 Tax=Ensete ventricosum TaxID=4639 RepID=A0A426ZW03_ENSVE|nr:hypothetical protein B296_00016913 [Ensete ventricosum]